MHRLGGIPLTGKKCVSRRKIPRMPLHIIPCWRSPATIHICGYSSKTGRTDQIRVHLAYLGHPVLGDDVYGKPFPNLTGQCLHAGKIGFMHPTTGEYMEFTSPLPDYFQAALRKLRFTEKTKKGWCSHEERCLAFLGFRWNIIAI